MRNLTRERFLAVSTAAVPLLAVSAVLLLAPIRTPGQVLASRANATSKSTSAGTPAKYKAPRMPDGKPDFTGYWTNQTATPLERPASFNGREFLTPEEVAEIEQLSIRKDLPKAPPGSVGGYNAIFIEPRKVNATRRTSMITDPKDGKLPPLTPEAKQKYAAERLYRDQHHADDAQHMYVWDRCLWMPNIGPPMMPYAYNNSYHIVQTPGQVAIAAEMLHDFRVIPVDGRPHGNSPRWSGDPVGHYEGDTLVVETILLNGRAEWDDGNVKPSMKAFSAFSIYYHTSSRTRVTERFTRTAPDILLYQFTIEDPTIYTSPWSGEITMRSSKDPVYEYACHEGNYALVDILSGVRAEEKAAAEKSGASKQ